MPRPKRLTVLTSAPAHSPAAIDELKTGIEDFIEWANRARTGKTSLPAAVHADEALTAFSEGRFHIRAVGLSAWAFVAGKNILSHVRDGHWHLRVCPFCNQWLLAKSKARKRCRRRADCVRDQAAHRQARRRQKVQLEDEQFKPQHPFRHRAAR